MPNHPDYKETKWYKRHVEEARSDPNTRKLRIAGHHAILNNGGYYILTPIKDKLEGREFKTLIDGHKRDLKITEVYPHCVIAEYTIVGALDELEHTLRVGFSIPELMEKHIISCSMGYCEVI